MNWDAAINFPTSSLLCLSLQSCSAASHRSLDDHFLPVGVCAVCAWFSTNKHQLTPLRLLWQALTLEIHVSLSASLCIFQRVRADVILHFIFTAELLSLSKANEFWDRVFGPWIHLIYFSESSFACLPETEPLLLPSLRFRRLLTDRIMHAE